MSGYNVELLKSALDRSVGKTIDGKRASAYALTDLGQHVGALLLSDSRLSTITPEQGALLTAVQNHDYSVNSVVVMRETIDTDEILAPRDLQVLIDFYRRSGVVMSFALIDSEGEERFFCDDIRTLSPLYLPKVEQIIIPQTSGHVEPSTLYDLAVEALAHGFSTGLGKTTRYGSAVIGTSGQMYLSGQYSGFNGSGTIHSELGAVYAALMNGDEVSEIGLVSERFTDSPASMCGNCRQMLVEISQRTGLIPKIQLFSLDGTIIVRPVLADYLPDVWKVESV